MHCVKTDEDEGPKDFNREQVSRKNTTYLGKPQVRKMRVQMELCQIVFQKCLPVNKCKLKIVQQGKVFNFQGRASCYSRGRVEQNVLGQSSVLPGEGRANTAAVLPGQRAVQKSLAQCCSRAESASRRLAHSCPTAPHHIQGGFPHTHKHI